MQEPEYFVECFGGWLPGWYFVSRLHGLQRAVELAAVMREIKGNPARVRPVEPNQAASPARGQS